MGKMKTITQLCPLSFLVILVYLSGTVESGDNSLINDDIGGVLYKTEDDLETRNYKKSDEYYNACTYSNGNDPNIHKNIEEIIKVLVKDSLQPAMATLDEQEHDIARDVQVAANEIIIELALHASRITQKILKSMKRTNGTQVAVDTEMHNKLIVYRNQIEKIEELEDKITLLSNKTKELTDTINVNNKQQSESMASMNNKIAILNNLTDTINVNNKQLSESMASMNNKIVILNNLTDTINVNNKQQSESMASMNNKIVILNNFTDTINVNNKQQSESMASMNNKIVILNNLTDTINVNNKQQSESIAIINNKITVLENLTKTDIEKIQNSVMNLSETCQKVEEIATKVRSFCDVKLPASIVPNPNIWKGGQIPEKDDLDTYMINKTGCSYLVVEYGKPHVLAAGPLPGQLEWRGAVRTRGEAGMTLVWNSGYKYDFWVGGYSNTKSGLNDHVHLQYPNRATPGVLAEDRYVPVYIKIKNGKLTAGAECGPEPWFTADFTWEEGELIQRRVYSHSRYGAKFLYDCPASFTGQ